MTEQLTQLYNEIRDCKECPKSLWSSGYKEPGWGVQGEILFIGQSPAFTSLSTQPGNSSFDKRFKSLLKEAEIYDDNYFFTNLVKFPPLKELSQFTVQELTHINKHLEDEIRLIKPVVIVSLGAPAKEWLMTFYHPAKHALVHPGAIKYGTITRQEFIQKLREVNEIYRALKKVET